MLKEKSKNNCTDSILLCILILDYAELEVYMDKIFNTWAGLVYKLHFWRTMTVYFFTIEGVG